MKFRGHEIEESGEGLVYKDTKESVPKTWMDRPCGYCGKENTPEGHDGCLGTLPGVMNACCGHGEQEDAYVQFLDGKSIHGKNALQIMGLIKASEIR